MTHFNRYRQTSSLQRLACFYFFFVSFFWAGSDLSAQEETSVEEQLRGLLPSATAVDRESFENIANAPKLYTRCALSISLTSELLMIDRKTIQGSSGEFRYLTESKMPNAIQLTGEIYRDVEGSGFRRVTHPVTMIQEERITKLEADVNGDRATGSFEFHVPELYEGKVDFTAEKTGGEWRLTRFEMPKLKIDIRVDEYGHWWRTEGLQKFGLPKCLDGHTGTVWSLDFSRDGTRLVSGSNDGSVRIWNVAETKTVLTIPGAHKPSSAAPSIGGVLSVCFSPDEQSIATAGDDGTAKIWDAQTGELQWKIPVKNMVEQVIFTPDGKSLVVVSDEVTVWNISRKESFTIEGLSFPTIAVSPVGNTLVSADQESNREANGEQRDHHLKLFEITTGRELAASTVGHEILVTDVKFSPDGKRIASSSRDKTVKIWDAKSLRLLKTIEDEESEFQSLFWSPGGRWLAGGGWMVFGQLNAINEEIQNWNGGVYIWNSDTGELHTKLPEHPKGVRCVAFSPDGKQIVTAGHDGVIRLWASESERE